MARTEQAPHALHHVTIPHPSLPFEGKAFRAHPGPGLCPTSSLVCFCITFQAFFLSARKPASAPCAAPAFCTARPPSRTRPQARTKPHLCPPITGPNPNAPGRSAASDRNGPARRKTGFPQSLHRLFHNFAGFPQRLSFPLAFFERDRVRYAYPVRSYCAVRPGLVWYGWVRYGAPLLLCDITRDRKSPPFRAWPVTDPINIHFKG